uniref:Uncharacterized protein n=1 Tax=Aegilops tauschii subsp. strangulata TaxID=200361 RepID=A0A453HZE7_AEGTS
MATVSFSSPASFAGDNSGALTSATILRFPPNFVRQLSTKARRNCSNIGVAQIVAAAWSDRRAVTSHSGGGSRVRGTSSHAAAASAATLAERALLGSDASLAV